MCCRPSSITSVTDAKLPVEILAQGDVLSVFIPSACSISLFLLLFYSSNCFIHRLLECRELREL